MNCARVLVPYTLLGLCVLGLRGCTANPPPDASFSNGITDVDAPVFTAAIVSYVHQILPPAQSILALGSDTAYGLDPVATLLRSALVKQGYGLSLIAQGDKRAHRLQYRIAPFQYGYLLQITLDGRQVSQFFVHNKQGALQPAAAMSVKQT